MNMIGWASLRLCTVEHQLRTAEPGAVLRHGAQDQRELPQAGRQGLLQQHHLSQVHK